ncbi:MAG: toxin-antitoxin system, toxin component, PIN family protein [Boseongicola sp. SB0662_bin_57]|nr:toxin-antitoxin system, toxin component, PIN family protein [Boseongicola sp. SB0662_bin_57]
MKFLLDVCVASRILHDTLAKLGHDVLSARDELADASDKTLLDVAYREGRVLVTEDKDFGELVFALRLPHPCIVRLDGLTAAEEAVAMRNLIDREGAAMRTGAIIVVTENHVRIRSAENTEGRND